MVPTPAVRNLIREGKTHQLYSALQTGGAHGMQTMDAALVDLVRRGKITQKYAESRSSSPEELKRLLGEGGAAPPGSAPIGQPTVNIGAPNAGGSAMGGGPNGGAVSIGRPSGGRG